MNRGAAAIGKLLGRGTKDVPIYLVEETAERVEARQAAREFKEAAQERLLRRGEKSRNHNSVRQKNRAPRDRQQFTEIVQGQISVLRVLNAFRASRKQIHETLPARGPKANQ